MPTEPTPVGKSAVDLDPRLRKPEPVEENPAVRPATAPGGMTPVGASAADQAGFPGRPAGAAPPAQPTPTDTVSAGPAPTTPPGQTIANLTMLARQAIANGWETMSASPRLVSEACDAYRTMAQRVEELERSLELAEAKAAAPVDGDVFPDPDSPEAKADAPDEKPLDTPSPVENAEVSASGGGTQGTSLNPHA